MTKRDTLYYVVKAAMLEGSLLGILGNITGGLYASEDELASAIRGAIWRAYYAAESDLYTPEVCEVPR